MSAKVYRDSYMIRCVLLSKIVFVTLFYINARLIYHTIDKSIYILRYNITVNYMTKIMVVYKFICTPQKNNKQDLFR